LPSLLHITNGSAIVGKMREAGIVGRIVPWDDVLHEGPVPAGLNTAALRDVRAQFIASIGGSYDEVARSFAERDRAVDALSEGTHTPAARVEEVVLWFEHDLYDQLQLIQVLDRLPDTSLPVTAVPGDDYLGLQPVGRFAGLFAARRPITSAQRVAARDAWGAFRATDPRAVVDAIPRVTVLPHLPAALLRHLQQFPSTDNGLSRTEQQTLEAIARGVTLAKDVFVAANHEREEAMFMGDVTFLFHIRALIDHPRPLIVRPDAAQSTRPIRFDDTLALTEDGKRVLDGQADRIALCGIDRWLGGVHLTAQTAWRWNNHTKVLDEGS
jgi:hypothetical protein